MRYWKLGSYFRRMAYIPAETLEEACKTYIEELYPFPAIFKVEYLDSEVLKELDRGGVAIKYSYRLYRHGNDFSITRDVLTCVYKEITMEEYAESLLD